MHSSYFANRIKKIEVSNLVIIKILTGNTQIEINTKNSTPDFPKILD